MESTKQGWILLGHLMLSLAEWWTSPRMEIILLLWVIVQFLSSLIVKKFLPESWLEFSMSQFVFCLSFCHYALLRGGWLHASSRMLSTRVCHGPATEHQRFPWLKLRVLAQRSKCNLNGEEFHWLDRFFLRDLNMTVLAAKPCIDPCSTFCPPSLQGPFL